MIPIFFYIFICATQTGFIQQEDRELTILPSSSIYRDKFIHYPLRCSLKIKTVIPTQNHDKSTIKENIHSIHYIDTRHKLFDEKVELLMTRFYTNHANFWDSTYKNLRDYLNDVVNILIETFQKVAEYKKTKLKHPKWMSRGGMTIVSDQDPTNIPNYESFGRHIIKIVSRSVLKTEVN